MPCCVSRVCLSITLLSAFTFAQKVKVGYDKSVDFSQFRSYTWAEPDRPPARPLLYANIVGVVDDELKTKGLVKSNNGDLILIPMGGIGFGLNTAARTPVTPNFNGPMPALDTTMWIGAGGPSNLTAVYVPEGTMMLTFVERGANRVIWSGTVTEKLDVEQKMKSLERINKAVTKLIQQFPPKKKK